MTQKAVIAQVDLGFIQIEGLMLPNGQYCMAVTQVANLFLFSTPNYASQELKRLLGKDFKPHKCSTPFNRNTVNVISLQDLSKIALLLAYKGNEQAQAFNLACIEETLDRRFNHAFGVKCTEDEYNEKLKLRFKRLMARHDYTDILMERHIDLFGVKPEPNDYRDWTVMVNTKLFGVKHFNCNRDNMTMEQQELISDFERTAKRYALKNTNLTPIELVIKTLDTF